ncbi:MAG: hypothetical protein HZB16_21405 [Armatimonadetes bacterium]|nr:hypothetical protein [Armatimonadota bacterium]
MAVKVEATEQVRQHKAVWVAWPTAAMESTEAPPEPLGPVRPGAPIGEADPFADQPDEPHLVFRGLLHNGRDDLPKDLAILVTLPLQADLQSEGEAGATPLTERAEAAVETPRTKGCTTLGQNADESWPDCGAVRLYLTGKKHHRVAYRLVMQCRGSNALRDTCQFHRALGSETNRHYSVRSWKDEIDAAPLHHCEVTADDGCSLTGPEMPATIQALASQVWEHGRGLRTPDIDAQRSARHLEDIAVGQASPVGSSRSAVVEAVLVRPVEALTIARVLGSIGDDLCVKVTGSYLGSEAGQALRVRIDDEAARREDYRRSGGSGAEDQDRS